MKHFLILFLLVFTFSCKNESKPSDIQEPAEEQQVEDTNKYTLKAFAASEPFHGARIFFKGYKNGVFDFDVIGDKYKLGEQTPDAAQKMCANSGEGQHIHLIADSAPYAAKYVEEFEHSLEDGEYHILAFLSRSYHESIKHPDARIAMKATIENKTITAQDAIEGPMLFYSRPKGTYVGKKNTEKVMLDFYLHNVNLGQEYKVIANINGEDHTIQRWEPYYIEGLPIGKNTITLTLVDAGGNAVEVPNNPVTREFELKEDPAENIES